MQDEAGVQMIVQDRGRAAFEAMFHRCAGDVLRFARRRLGGDDDAAWDVVSETFIAAWRRWPEGAPRDEAEYLPWLYGFAANVVRNQLRSGRRRHALTHRLAAVRTSEARDVADSLAQAHAVRQAFERLPTADREVLALAGWEGLGPSEIARVLDISATAAGVRLHRARRRLRALLSLPSDAASRHDEPEPKSWHSVPIQDVGV